MENFAFAFCPKIFFPNANQRKHLPTIHEAVYLKTARCHLNCLCSSSRRGPAIAAPGLVWLLPPHINYTVSFISAAGALGITKRFYRQGNQAMPSLPLPTSFPSFQHSLRKYDQFDQQSWDTINRFLDSSDRVTRFQDPSANLLKPAKQEEQEANCFP